MFQVLAGVGGRMTHQILGASGKNNLTSLVPAIGPKINDIIGTLDHI